ncbi:MAG: hypothetical protein LUG18_08360 [Candidatus Azobacteroides sp.]|nr:hypothetical protein [Candidatus Azobacteroides sp.]
MSTKYQMLETRIRELETNLLPPSNPLGSYTSKEQDFIRAYCLLCHAEIEAYIEDYTSEIIDLAFESWSANKAVLNTIIFHLTYNCKTKDTPYSMANLAYKDLKKTIKSNNGIKENNLMNIFRPIGFEVDPLLKSTLNDFGKNRGEIAHTSFQTQSTLDPLNEKKNVKQILNGLKDFDQELYDYVHNGVICNIPQNMQWNKYTWKQRIKIFCFGGI